MIFIALSNLCVALSAAVFLVNGWDADGSIAVLGGALLGLGVVWAVFAVIDAWEHIDR